MSNQPATPQEQPPEAVPTFDMNNPPYTEEEKAALASKRAAAEPASATQTQTAAQPQPAAQPTAGQPQPMQPGRPMGPMPPKQGMSKGLLWSLIGGGIGVFVLIVIIIVCVMLFSGPSTDDYRKAYAILSEFNASRNLRLNATSQQSVDEFIKQADDHMDRLGKSAAMRDGEVKKAFDDYKGDYEKVKPLLGEVSAVVEASKTVSDACRTSSSSSILSSANGEEAGKKYDEQQSSCLKALNKMKDSQYSSLRDYANEQINYRKGMRDYYVALINYYKNRQGDSSPKRPDYPRTTLNKSISSKLSDLQSSSKESTQRLGDILRTKGKMGIRISS
ncbi:MAG: hypothetical protein D8B38_05710 [Candidatus Saccharimonas sp.]|nr:MAG: hypothetical protein D8B38_05710 [Candidatus Saccharimonas sp.]